MKLICAPKDYAFSGKEDELEVVLYGYADTPMRGSAGAAIKDKIVREKLHAASRAWDFLSIALSVNAADLAGHRDISPDGWVREFDLQICVSDPDFWNTQQGLIRKLLSFLTTDRWQLRFIGSGVVPVPDCRPDSPKQNCVALLSGGLDSFIGCVDLIANGYSPFIISQTVRGDADKQCAFVQAMDAPRHLQINHNTELPDPENPPSQRARSLIFLAYAVLAATTLERYHASENVTVYMCENGFISINPPLTGARLGSLSTRTTHPVFLRLIQQLLDSVGLRIFIENPYQLKTKGDMLRECANQQLLRAHAAQTTSCGRFKHYGYKHCGRCVPCLVRRAAFQASGLSDTTDYVYKNLGIDDEDHAGFDDVRAAAMAVAQVNADGLEAWIGPSLSTALLTDISQLEATVGRGLGEVGELLKSYGVK
jgi:7-cyano-7-deazaguanine synthase in queuosine biosynthesis